MQAVVLHEGICFGAGYTGEHEDASYFGDQGNSGETGCAMLRTLAGDVAAGKLTIPV